MFVNRNRRPARHTVRGVAVILAGWLSVTGGVAGQPSQPVTESRVRALTRQARRDAKGDATALVLTLDRLVRDAWGEFESFPLSILRRDDLMVTLSAPYMTYRRALVDRLRTNRPSDGIPWVDSAVLSVSPARVSSPDLERVVLRRDGRVIPAVKDGLTQMTFSNANGEQVVLHAGDIHWPASAFAPGGDVTVTLHPRQGDPFVYTFSDAELATFK